MLVSPSLTLSARRAGFLRAAAAFLFACILVLQAGTPVLAQKQMTSADLQRIGKHIWQNECDGKVEGLTSWNSGEAFASLGIGHFIWYPAGPKGPFEESFPLLLSWFKQRGVQVPGWLLEAKACPWSDQASFRKDHDSQRQKELRQLLSRTVEEQVLFVISRLNAAMPRMQAAAGSSGARVAANMQLLAQTPAGCFAMIDYVNFKGEGLKPEESFKGEGWGLLQVLQTMQAADAASAPGAFAAAAKQVLTRRVKNSPPERGEQRWLKGWLNRCEAYGK